MLILSDRMTGMELEGWGRCCGAPPPRLYSYLKLREHGLISLTEISNAKSESDHLSCMTMVCLCLGGSILSTRCSETYETKTALMSLFGFPLWYFSQSPRAVIQVSCVLTQCLLQEKLRQILHANISFFNKLSPHQPDVHPGNCWAFKGSTGYLVIRLCVKIVPTAFSLEHIPKALSPTGNITSAPRNFTVYVRHMTESKLP